MLTSLPWHWKLCLSVHVPKHRSQGRKTKKHWNVIFCSLCLMRFRMVCVPRVVSIVCNGILAHFLQTRVFLWFIFVQRAVKLKWMHRLGVTSVKTRYDRNITRTGIKKRMKRLCVRACFWMSEYNIAVEKKLEWQFLNNERSEFCVLGENKIKGWLKLMGAGSLSIVKLCM